MARPDFAEIYMSLATHLALRSTCRRLQVGCVITSTDYRKVMAVGYNGGASGLENDCDTVGELAVGNCGCLHSEENAIINCDSPRYVSKCVFVTHLPCLMCAKRFINLGGVHKIYYLNDYRKRDSLLLLERAGILIERYKYPDVHSEVLLREATEYLGGIELELDDSDLEVVPQ